ncbi:MAG TPA: pantetheine-phosphate adenylyltransferase [Candidatus Methylomirabilis sp.]|nr:pantetheine-phosphate adenylyltransferase [Candidatus Methylomirabilis sp.]
MAAVAIYPGTFDPFTNGHLDILQRARRLFAEVLVAVAAKPEKSPLFTAEERMAIVRDATRDLPGVRIAAFDTLLVDYARAQGARVIIRGLRAVSDFEYEFQMALMNRRLAETVETVFLMPHEAYSYLSSRLVKEIALLGGAVSGLVPALAEKMLAEKLRAGRGRATGRRRVGRG